ncbi:MAG TPA: CBS domain-containing protein [Burkholderiales bacterium]
MAIGELCSRDVVFVALNESCALAAQLMREQHVGSLVVVREEGARRVPAGIVTDRDLVVGVMALGLDADKTLVETVMRPGLAVLREDEGVGRAIALMRDKALLERGAALLLQKETLAEAELGALRSSAA